MTYPLRFSPARYFLLAAFVAVGYLGPIRTSDADETSDAGQAMVSVLHLGNNLEALSLKAAHATVTYRGIQSEVGASKAESALRNQLAQVIPKHQAQWDENLASCYAEFMTVTELRSIAKEQRSSPYVEKFESVRGDVGGCMQEKSSDLLQKVIAEALSALLSDDDD